MTAPDVDKSPRTKDTASLVEMQSRDRPPRPKSLTYRRAKPKSEEGKSSNEEGKSSNEQVQQ